MSTPPRIYLSSPHLGSREFEYVREAFETNWIAPLGPQVDAFEREFAAAVGSPHAAALSSGTAALHLALKLIGLKAGEEVLCSTLTFSASANPIAYEGGRPVFIDSERTSWNLDPVRLEEALRDRARRGSRPRAVILVHLYGQPVKIVDLARQMIELSGFKPDDDIEITFTGLKPGEKLYEELQHHTEEYAPTTHPRIMRLKGSVGLSESELKQLEQRLYEFDANQLKAMMKRLVPEYTPFLD